MARHAAGAPGGARPATARASVQELGHVDDLPRNVYRDGEAEDVSRGDQVRIDSAARRPCRAIPRPITSSSLSTMSTSSWVATFEHPFVVIRSSNDMLEVRSSSGVNVLRPQAATFRLAYFDRPARATGRRRRSTAASSTCAAPPSGSATSPTTSPDHSSNPAASDPNYTLDCEEPDTGIEPVTSSVSAIGSMSTRVRTSVGAGHAGCTVVGGHPRTGPIVAGLLHGLLSASGTPPYRSRVGRSAYLCEVGLRGGPLPERCRGNHGRVPSRAPFSPLGFAVSAGHKLRDPRGRSSSAGVATPGHLVQGASGAESCRGCGSRGRCAGAAR